MGEREKQVPARSRIRIVLAKLVSQALAPMQSQIRVVRAAQGKRADGGEERGGEPGIVCRSAPPVKSSFST